MKLLKKDIEAESCPLAYVKHMPFYVGMPVKLAKLAPTYGISSSDFPNGHIPVSSIHSAYYAKQMTPPGEAWGIVRLVPLHLFANKFFPLHEMIPSFKRAKANRNTFYDYQHLWDQSFTTFNTAFYGENIPPQAIDKVMVFDPSQNEFIANYASSYKPDRDNSLLVKFRLALLAKWFMAEEIEPLTWLAPLPLAQDNELYGPEIRVRALSALSTQRGLEWYFSRR